MKEYRLTIREEICATADELRALKRWLRTRPDERPARPVTRFALAPLKRRATLLCMAMAHSRGRVHAKGAGADDQERELAEALRAMDAMKVATPVLDARRRDAARAILAIRREIVARTACVAPTEERRA